MYPLSNCLPSLKQARYYSFYSNGYNLYPDTHKPGKDFLLSQANFLLI